MCNRHRCCQESGWSCGAWSFAAAASAVGPFRRRILLIQRGPSPDSPEQQETLHRLLPSGGSPAARLYRHVVTPLSRNTPKHRLVRPSGVSEPLIERSRSPTQSFLWLGAGGCGWRSCARAPACEGVRPGGRPPSRWHAPSRASRSEPRTAVSSAVVIDLASDAPSGCARREAPRLRVPVTNGRGVLAA